MARICGSMSSTARRRNASSTMSRRRVWSGSSIVNMLLATVPMTFRHPPGQPDQRPALLAQREQRAVLQHPRRRLVGRGDPDAAYDRESRRDGRTDRAQLRDAGLRITKKRLAGEIELHMPCHRAVPHCRFATRSRWCATVKPQGSPFLIAPAVIRSPIRRARLTPAACRGCGTTRSSSAPTPGPSCALPRSRRSASSRARG